jgi:hypothetical protein
MTLSRSVFGQAISATLASCAAMLGPVFATAVLALNANGAMAQQFDAGIPAGWTCTGNCGTSADVFGPSVVALPPSSSSYGWVSTYGSLYGDPTSGLPGVSPFPNASVPSNGIGNLGNTNGSVLRSTAFVANSGEVLKFEFNYVTSDGNSFADYAWARLLNAGNGSQAAVIFTARTNADTTAPVIPGFGITYPDTTLTPTSVLIGGGYVNGDPGPDWSPLGPTTCYDTGCGYTGWVGASYNVANTGNYVLEFGVTNWDDTIWDSGMAFNTVTIGRGTGLPGDDVYIDDNSRHVGAVPEPETYAMMLAGLGLMGFMARRRQLKQSIAA